MKPYTDAEIETVDDLTKRLAGVVADMLSNFYEPGHPGEPCRRTGWVPERSLKAWRAVYAEWAEREACRD